jgi:plastocyanin
MRIVCASIIAATAACGGGSSTPVDAAPDAPVIPVELLDRCPDTVAATVTDSSTAFIPMESTIRVGDDVKFMITSEHIVIPNTLVMTDPALNIGRGETKCFRFHKPGTYGFLCQVHGFTGTITVQ